MSTPLAAFGPGILIVTRTDTVVPVAINVGFAQELTLDFAGTTKQLFGQFQFPLVVARGTIKGTGKWKAAVLSGVAWNAAMYGMTSLSTSSALNVTWNVGATFSLSTSTNQFNVSNFDADLGITVVTSTVWGGGLPFLRVGTGTESSGKYSVTSTGQYTFGASDTTGLGTGGTQAIKLTYTSQTATPSGQALQVTNQLIGTTPTFQLDYYTSLNQPTAKAFAVRLYACVSSKQVLAAKLEDFIMPEHDFDFFATASGNVVNYVFPEIS